MTDLQPIYEGAPEDERKRRVQRAVADRVTDEMLTKQTGDLTEAEVAILTAALNGPHGDEIVARIDAIAKDRS